MSILCYSQIQKNNFWYNNVVESRMSDTRIISYSQYTLRIYTWRVNVKCQIVGGTYESGLDKIAKCVTPCPFFIDPSHFYYTPLTFFVPPSFTWHHPLFTEIGSLTKVDPVCTLKWNDYCFPTLTVLTSLFDSRNMATLVSIARHYTIHWFTFPVVSRNETFVKLKTYFFLIMLFEIWNQRV